MKQAHLVGLGARIPVELKRVMSDYCNSHGIKMNFFVIQALKEKLMEVDQIAYENKIVDARIKENDYVSKEDFDKHLVKRKKKNNV